MCFCLNCGDPIENLGPHEDNSSQLWLYFCQKCKIVWEAHENDPNTVALEKSLISHEQLNLSQLD